MSDPAPTSVSITRSASTAAPAVLVLDAAGLITAASASARTLWQTGDAELVGEHFASLFAFEVVSSSPDWLEAQWDVLLAAASEQAIPLTAQPREDAPRPVKVRLEKALTNAGGYFAFVEIPAPARATATPFPASAGAALASSGLALLAEKGAAGFFDLNFKEDRIHYSPAWKKLLGYVDAELPNTYDTWLKLIHPDDSGAAPDKLGKKAGAAGTRPFSVEFRMKHRLGHDVWIQSIGLQSVGEGGALERVVGLHLDITERKEIEEASLANDDRLRALSDDDGPLGAFELDFTQARFWFSPAWKKLLGYEDAELPSGPDTLAGILPPEEAEAGANAYFLGRATGQDTFVEIVHWRHKDGSRRPLLLGVTRTLNRKRELTRAVGFCAALPAVASASSSAAAEEGSLSPTLTTALFDAIAEGVLVTDAKGKILHLNPAAARLLNLPVEKALHQPVGDVFHLVNRQSGRPGDDPVDRALSTEEPLPLINEHALAPAAEGAAPTPISWTARAAADRNGRPAGVVIAFRNPDEMRLTPDELVKANRFESLGLLAGGIAHDFNNLLTTILGGVSIAKDSRDYSALADAEKACLTAKGLTKQLLAFAKGGAGTQVVVAVQEILDDTVKIAAAGSVAEVTVEVTEGTEPVLVDRAQILQVFQNLVVNALQAMPPAPHKARVQLHAANVALAADQIPSLPAGNYIQFEARDNGSGIKPEYLEKIWDPFFTTKKHGTGLGLATVLSIVRKHGGIIGVESTLGVGTTFTIFLPAADRPVEVQARRAAALRFGTGRVLFMDDDPKITALTASMLQSLDYKYDLAKTGEEAITLYQRYLNIGRPYDAVIMDLTVIGGMGGEECFHALKKLDPDVRAIVSSGYDNDDMARKFLDLGFCGYLTKPYRVTDLGKVLKAVLG